MRQNSRERRWWGWGYLDESYSLANRPYAWSYLENKLGKLENNLAVIKPNQIKLVKSRISSKIFELLTDVCGTENIDISVIGRLTHSLGQSYGDLIRLREGKVDNPVDLVIYPTTESQIIDILKIATKYQIAIIPYGGGTNVTGSTEMRGRHEYNGLISLDMTKMTRCYVDPVSQIIIAETGILGPEIEAMANCHQLTLGHFPQSFEFSSLGGWIATRSAGQNSIKYGKVEDMLISLRTITPVGILETKTIPASAAGPDLKQLFVGSEGTFGIITQATLKLHPMPELTKTQAFLFKSFSEGIQAVREIMQSELTPSVLRLSDEAETEAYFMLRTKSKSRIKNIVQTLATKLLNMRGYSFFSGSLMLVFFDGNAHQVDLDKKITAKLCKKYNAISIGNSPGKSWLKERFKLPYFRDVLIDNGVMIDTLETAATWDKIGDLYLATKNAIRQAVKKYNVNILIFVHVSHAYTSGASLYFTFISKQCVGDKLTQWLDVKKAAIDTILENNGTLSHHHGVGRDHAFGFEREVGLLGRDTILQLKNQFDPQCILNPFNFE